MKPLIRFGLLTGLAVCAWNLCCFTVVSWFDKILSLGIPIARIRAYSGLFGIVILMTGIYIGISAVKRRSGNQITGRLAFRTGISITIISALMAGFFAFIYCTVINPGYKDFMIKEAATALEASQKTTTEIRQRLGKVSNQFSTSTQVLQALIAQSVMGTLGSFVFALFIRTKKRE